MIYKIEVYVNIWSCIDLYKLTEEGFETLKENLKDDYIEDIEDFDLINYCNNIGVINSDDWDYSILDFFPNDCDFELCVKDENDEIVFKTEDVLEFKDRTFDLEEQLKETTAKMPNNFYLYYERKEKGAIVLQGELNLDEEFDKEKLYLIRNMADPYVTEVRCYDPSNFIYYQRGTHHELDVDKIELGTEEFSGMCKWEVNKIIHTNSLDFGYQVNNCASLLVDVLEYELDEDSKTAIVCSCNQEASGEIIIPKTIVRDGEIYSVTKINSFAFEECWDITSITIPDSVTKINDSTFGYTALTSIVVDSNNKVYDSRNNCNAIIETASNTLIQGCGNTTIPDSVTKIGEYAFEDCTGLTSITIPKGIDIDNLVIDEDVEIIRK